MSHEENIGMEPIEQEAEPKENVALPTSPENAGLSIRQKIAVGVAGGAAVLAAGIGIGSSLGSGEAGPEQTDQLSESFDEADYEEVDDNDTAIDDGERKTVADIDEMLSHEDFLEENESSTNDTAEEPEEDQPSSAEQTRESIPRPRVLNPENIAAPITSSDPEELMEQYMNNKSCSLNSPDFENIDACVEAMFGNHPAIESSLQVFREKAYQNHEWVQPRRDFQEQQDMGPYHVKLGWEILEQEELANGNIVIRALLSTDYAPVNIEQDTLDARLEFAPGTTEQRNMQYFDEPGTVYTLLPPGEDIIRRIPS